MSDFRAHSDGIKNDGYFDDRYGKYGLCENGTPVVSPPIKFVDAPKGTVSFAIVAEDKDAVMVSGFSWIHWLACNVHEDIGEDASRNAPEFLQGVNSLVSIQGERKTAEEASFYGGMAPPDKDHLYEIHVYALDCDLPLKNGFYMNELYRAMEGHVLAENTLKGWYRS